MKKRHASPAQIAARKKFAAAARSGKFRRRRRRAKNPGNKAAHRAGKCNVCGEQMLPTNRPGWRHVSGPDWTKCKLERIERRTKRRAGNPSKKPAGRFQIAALRGRNSTLLFLSGIGLSSNRSAASNFGSVQTARTIAKQVRQAGKKLGIWKVAIVTTNDSPQEINRFLLGGA